MNIFSNLESLTISQLKRTKGGHLSKKWRCRIGEGIIHGAEGYVLSEGNTIGALGDAALGAYVDC